MTDKEITSRAIDVLRFPLAVMVVAIHTYFNESLNRFGTEIPFEGEWAHDLIFLFSIVLTDCAVPMFFVISGYLFFLKTPHITMDVWKRKMKGKVLTLMVPYLAWNVVSICSEPSRFLDASTLGKILQFWTMDWQSWGASGPYDGPLWFMRDLFVIMLVSPIIEWLVRKTRNAVLLLFLVPYSLGVVNITAGISMVGLLFFTLGACIAINNMSLRCLNVMGGKNVCLLMLVAVIAAAIRIIGKATVWAYYASVLWIFVSMVVYMLSLHK